MPGFPLAVSSPGTAGQVTVVPNPGPFCHVVLVADRKLVKMNVSPEESTRRTGTILVDGSLVRALTAAMAGSLQLTILPELILARMSPVSLRLLTPGTL